MRDEGSSGWVAGPMTSKTTDMFDEIHYIWRFRLGQHSTHLRDIITIVFGDRIKYEGRIQQRSVRNRSNSAR
jgi:hypothetical protein